MRYRLGFVFLTALAAITFAIAFFTPQRPELIVQGKSVSNWAMELRGPAPIEPAEKVIRSLGPEAVPDLVRMLRTRDSFFARPIIFLEPKLPARATRALENSFKPHEAAQQRLGAALALGLMRTNAAAAAPDLLRALRDRDASVRFVSGMTLGRIGTNSLPGLIAALDGRNRNAREAAFLGLYELGPAAFPSVTRLVSALTNLNERPRSIMVLQAIGKPAVPALIEALNQPAEDVRLTVMSVLGSMCGLARAAVPTIASVTRDSSPALRLKAVETLNEICNSCDPVVAALCECLNDENREVRRAAANFLKREPRAAEVAADQLLRTIESGAPSARNAAIANLSLMARENKHAMAMLRTLATRDDPTLSKPASEALEEIEPPAKKEQASVNESGVR